MFQQDDKKASFIDGGNFTNHFCRPVENAFFDNCIQKIDHFISSDFNNLRKFGAKERATQPSFSLAQRANSMLKRWCELISTPLCELIFDAKLGSFWL